MRVLGIDPGSRYCGFGVVEDAGGACVRHLAHGVLEVAGAGAIEDRLCALHEGLARELLRHRPELVAVEDVGIGMAPESLKRLFRAFYTTKPDGMGMGLSICRSIIEAHGGRAWASPNIGPGMTFQFTISGYE